MRDHAHTMIDGYSFLCVFVARKREAITNDACGAEIELVDNLVRGHGLGVTHPPE